MDLMQWNLYNVTRKVLIKPYKFCHLHGTVFEKLYVYSPCRKGRPDLRYHIIPWSFYIGFTVSLYSYANIRISIYTHSGWTYILTQCRFSIQWFGVICVNSVKQIKSNIWTSVGVFTSASDPLFRRHSCSHNEQLTLAWFWHVKSQTRPVIHHEYMPYE